MYGKLALFGFAAWAGAAVSNSHLPASKITIAVIYVI
jgi:hypothetical protein